MRKNGDVEGFDIESLKRVFRAFNKLKREGLIKEYGVVGAVGAMFYTQAFHTMDADIFILLEGYNQFPVYDRLASMGYDQMIHGNKQLLMEGIPVDIFAPYDPLTREALRNTKKYDFEGVKVQVVRPEYLIAMAYNLGRHKDLAKADMIMSQTKIDLGLLGDILERHRIRKP